MLALAWLAVNLPQHDMDIILRLRLSGSLMWLSLSHTLVDRQAEGRGKPHTRLAVEKEAASKNYVLESFHVLIPSCNRQKICGRDSVSTPPGGC